MSKLRISIGLAKNKIIKYFNYKSLIDRASGKYPIDPLTHVPVKYHQIIRDVINGKSSVQTYESQYLPEFADYYVCNIGITRAIYKATNYQFKDYLKKHRIDSSRIKQVSVSDIELGNSGQYLKESFSIDFVSRNRSYIRKFINSKYGVQLFPDSLTNEIFERSPDVLLQNRLLELGIDRRTGERIIDLKTGKPISSIKKNVLDSVSKAGGKDVVAPDINEFSDLISEDYRYEVKSIITDLSGLTDIIGTERVNIFKSQLEGNLKLIDEVGKNCEIIDQFLERGTGITRTDLEEFYKHYRIIGEDFSLGLDRSYRFTKYSTPEFFTDEFGKQPVRIFTGEPTEFDITAKFVENLRVSEPLIKGITFRFGVNILESYKSLEVNKKTMWSDKSPKPIDEDVLEKVGIAPEELNDLKKAGEQFNEKNEEIDQNPEDVEDNQEAEEEAERSNDPENIIIAKQY